MPTSSQSKILSAVDYQLLQQQHQQSSSGQDTTAKDFSINSVNPAPVIESKRRLSKDDRRSSIGRKDDDDNMLLTPLSRSARRRSSEKIGDGKMRTKKLVILSCHNTLLSWKEIQRGLEEL